MTQNNLLDWYEANLPARERKKRGHFSTPPHLVEQILDACGYTSEHDLSQIQVMDPACGSGNFVAGAARRLIAYGERAACSSDKTIAQLVQHNIWGFDPDPVACFLAEMQMCNVFTARDEADTKAGKRSPDTNYKGKIRQFHIHQADGLALPWQQGGQVDLFLANPPYLAAKNNDLSSYRSTQQRGQSDSYLLFLELALQVVRPGGWLGLVLPDPVLARSNAARERKRLLAETTVHYLWHLADVFAAYVGAVVIVAQKQTPSRTHAIIWKRERWLPNKASDEMQGGKRGTPRTHAGDSGVVSQTFLHLQTGAELRYLISRLQGTLIEHIYMQLHTAERTSHGLILLKDLVLIHRGEEISKESPLLHTFPAITEDGPQSDWYPVIRGGSEIRPYDIPGAQYWIAREKIVKPLRQYLTPKLLIVKSTDRLQASLDLQGHIVLQTLYTLSIASDVSGTIQPTATTQNHEEYSEQQRECVFNVEDELYYLHALLNSHLLQEYVYVLHTAYKWVQPQIEQHVLAHLPLPTHVDIHEKEQIIQRAKHMIQSCSKSSPDVELKEQNQACYEEQERAICRLYQAAIQEKRRTKPTQA